MLWLCLLPHRLALEALTPPADAPLAVTERRGPRRWVVASTLPLPAGADWGAVQALHPQLRAVGRNARAERAALESLAYLAYRFGQPVHLELREPARPGEAPVHAVWVEIAASLRLFGGLDALLAEARAALGGQPLSCRIGVAPTLEGAALAAQLDRPAARDRQELWDWLQGLPLPALRLPAETLAALRDSGLRRAGELLALPRDALARRFGAGAIGYLDRLTGRAPDLRPAVRPPPRYRRRLDLLGEVDSAESLLFPARRLMQELAQYLRARDTGVERFTLRMRHAGRAPSALELRLLAPSRGAEHLFQLLRERLERTALPAAVRELELCAEHFAAPEAPQPDLFGSAGRRDAEWRQLLEKLIARLGADAVLGLGLAADHRPERACTTGMPVAGAAPARLPPRGGDDGGRAPRPPWLLDPPRRLAGPPAVLGAAERIESGWWDGAPVARDYYTARAGDARLWVFQDRADGQWYLQGIWA